MAEVGPTSIQARIAALKLEQVGRTPNTPPPTYGQAIAGAQQRTSPSSPIKRPVTDIRRQTASVLTVAHSRIGNQPADAQTNGSHTTAPSTARPSLPPRPRNRDSEQSVPSFPTRKALEASPSLPQRRPSESPSLPPRRPSEYSLTRRESNESSMSTLSIKSSISASSTRVDAASRTDDSKERFLIRAPTYDAASLPPLPTRKAKPVLEPARLPLKATYSSPTVGMKSDPSSPSTSKVAIRPPLLPTRRETSRAEERASKGPELPRRSALSFALNKGTEVPPPLPRVRPTSSSAVSDSPPPVPVSSRPNLAQLQVSKPKLPPAAAAPNSSGSCLKCRDFSGPDNHAARFPRESIPSTDLTWLAHQLTSPFPSPTDKARVLFTWLHHNIAYNTVAFYSGNLKASTPASTLASGLAVCEGYASLFTALAMHAGLESMVVSGHGKGYGFTALKPGDPIPPFDSGHAWNAVKIDGGEWKLVDSCWGAGHVTGQGLPYVKHFAPQHFTKDNDEFGLSHYPADQDRFYRTDGRYKISWEEYILGPGKGVGGPTIFTGCDTEHGIGERTFLPATNKIDARGPPRMLRFQFSSICEHWDNERHGKGKPYLFVLKIGGVDGRNDDLLPFETNGRVWWCDVNSRELGAPGQTLDICNLTNFNGRDGRGLTVKEFKEEQKSAWAWGCVAEWMLI
ncbi:hypothetical protein LTR66_005689 [Elasticomyces elasticus]|nr:hypothetical protein LTR66_005689 [Elasticomyces elasticus]